MAGATGWRLVRGDPGARRALGPLALAAAAALAGLAPFLLDAGAQGPSMTLAEARDLPIFQHDGRAAFFTERPEMLLACSPRGSLSHGCLIYHPVLEPLRVLLMAAAGVWLIARLERGADSARLAAALSLVGLAAFAIAFAGAFRFHLPDRYAMSSVNLVGMLAVALAVVAALRRLGRWRQAFVATLFALVLLVAGVLGDVLTRHQSLVRNPAPQVMATLRQMPPDTTVAALVRAGDTVPAFASRPTFAALEFAVPYKRRHHYEMARRAQTLYALFAGPADPAWAARLQAEGIDAFLLGQAGWDGLRDWTRSFPPAAALPPDTVFDRDAQATAACTRAAQAGLRLIDARCLADRLVAARNPASPAGADH
jgi:hypothetical protein